jgi:hypothetical protein
MGVRKAMQDMITDHGILKPYDLARYYQDNDEGL